MRTITILAASLAAAMFASCEQLDGTAELASVPESPTKSVTFDIHADDLSVGKTSRATLAEASVTDILIIDRMDGHIAQTVSRSSADEDFDTPTLSLAYGTHQLTFIAHRSEAPVFSPEALTWTANKIRDTYVLNQDITITPESPANVTANLSRQVYQLKFLIQDALPSSLATVRISITDYYPTLLLSTLNASGHTSLTRDIAVPSSALGSTGLFFSVYGFCPTLGTEYTTTASIDFLTASGASITSHTLTDVPLETNCTTTISGNFFQAEHQASFAINTNWGTPKNIDL